MTGSLTACPTDTDNHARHKPSNPLPGHTDGDLEQRRLFHESRLIPHRRDRSASPSAEDRQQPIRLTSQRLALDRRLDHGILVLRCQDAGLCGQGFDPRIVSEVQVRHQGEQVSQI